MNTRIRYEKDGAFLVSTRVFVVNNVPYKVKLNVVEKTYALIDQETGAVPVQGGGTKNLTVLKRQAKRALVKLGYNFAGETRNVASKQQQQTA